MADEVLGYGADVVVEARGPARAGGRSAARRRGHRRRSDRGGAPDARDQVGRLLALVPYIQSRDEVSLEQAAADFGVGPPRSSRTSTCCGSHGLPGLGMGDLIDVDMDALEGEGVIRLSNADYLAARSGWKAPRPRR